MSQGAVAADGRAPFTIKTLLIPLLTRPRVAQAIKWTVYTALLINFGVYVYDDTLAYTAALADDAAWADIFTQFSTSIDMLGWVGLVFLFELETYSLPEHAFNKWVTRMLHGGRVVMYLLVVYAAYGYTVESLEYYDESVVPEVTNLCDVAGSGTSLQIDSITYAEITAANCEMLSGESVFYRVADEIALIDWPTLEHNRFQGWLDVINAYVWVLVVILIEIEVWLQNHDRFGGRTLTVVRQVKTIFYAVLTADMIIWAFTGYLLYAWDAFLWIFGFWAIELNLAEWERERKLELAERGTPAPQPLVES